MIGELGPWLERLGAIAATRKLIAVGGRRETGAASALHVLVTPPAKGKPVSALIGGAVTALCTAGDELVIAGSSDGFVRAFDSSGARLAELAVGAPVRSLAIDPDQDTLAVGTDDGAVHVLSLAIRDARPTLAAVARRALGDRPVHAVAFDSGMTVLAGGDDGLWVLPLDTGVPRPLAIGGEGGVRALCALGDGRIAAGLGDGSIRLGFLVGEVDAQDRSGEHAHAGAVRALALGPMIVDDAGREQPRRLLSAGEDGAIKAWLYDTNRKPRTLELGAGPIAAITVVAHKTEGAAGFVLAATQQRCVVSVALTADGELADAKITRSELSRLESDLKDQKPKAVGQRQQAVAALDQLPEDDARLLLDGVLATDAAPEVRLAAVQAIARAGRRLSRPAIRKALGDAAREVRAAAFTALVGFEADQPMAPVRAALAAAAEDVRLLAVERMPAIAATSPLVLGLAADALADASVTVRRAALTTLRTISPPGLAPIRTALARGPADVRARAITVVAFGLGLRDGEARALVAGALDDADPEVRAAAFRAAVVQHPALAARLRALDPALDHGLVEAATTPGERTIELPAADPRDTPLDDTELAPLFAALACRQADSALRGAGALIRLRDTRAIGAVLQLSREADAALRRTAVAVLADAATRFPDDDRLTARLAWLLDDVDAMARGNAMAALEATATGSIAHELDLAEIALRASRDDIRVRALQLLIKHGGDEGAARAGALLGDALDDEAAAVRAEAFRTLWAWHAQTPQVPLERGARSRHADLRGQVVAELTRRRDAKQTTPAFDALLRSLVGDAAASVGLAAYTALTRPDAQGTIPDDAKRPAVHLAAMASPSAQVRAAGAAGSIRTTASAVRSKLLELLQEDHPQVHLAAIEAWDTLLPDDAEGFVLAFASIFYELQIKAGELCGRRRDRRAVAPMQRLLSIPRTDANRPTDALRQRAARALADVGDPATIAFLIGLLDDEDPTVREMGARGLATACGPGGEQPLVDALAHADLPVRSWAAEGLAKLGDVRALPVLAGTQRHDHRPIRIGAIVGLVALGPDGVRGLRQGLDDPDREVQDLAFAVIVARDVALADAGVAPDLLLDTLTSSSPELRFAGARLLEARAAGEDLSPASAELVGPPVPDKPAELVDWPAEPRRRALLDVLVDTLASDEPGKRYAAVQVLALRPQPNTFWRELARLAGPAQAHVPHTNWSSEGRQARKAGWLRRVVIGGRADDAAAPAPAASELERLANVLSVVGGETPGTLPPRAGAIDVAAVRRLVFGVYAGLVRQGGSGVDETHRVRRDAVARLQLLAGDAAVGPSAVLPVLDHALGDPHHLVRQAAMAAVRALHPAGALAPLAQALRAAADLGKAAVEELLALALAGDAEAAALLRDALDADVREVRELAAVRLPRLYPPEAVEPLLLALQSRHADVRLTAVWRLLDAKSSQVTEALAQALASNHPDLRFKAAQGLARRGNPRGVDVLAAFLRNEDQASDAVTALVELATTPAGAAAAAGAIGARLLDDPDRNAPRAALVDALGKIGDHAGVPALLALLAEQADAPGRLPHALVLAQLARIAADRGARPVKLPDGSLREPYREVAALPWLTEAAKRGDADLRARLATLLGGFDDRAVEELLGRLLVDRDEAVRIAAAEALARRVHEVAGATLGPLEAALRGGRRELVLPAAAGLAARRRPEAFQPLLLVLEAGDGLAPREAAALALGTLGDRRALAHLLPLLDPAQEDEAKRALAPAVAEAIGRMLPHLTDPAHADEDRELRERLERLARTAPTAIRLRALIGLRHAGDARSRALLEEVAADRDAPPEVRNGAIAELGRLGDASSVPMLADALSDDHYGIRQGAIAALRQILAGDPTRVSLLAVGSKYTEVSEVAATYLAVAGDPRSLVPRFGEIERADVRRRLREGLVRRGAYAADAIAAALAEVSPRARIEGAWLAGASGDQALAGKVTAAVRAAAEGWRAARDRRIAGSLGPPALEDREALEAEAWRASLWAARRVGASVDAEAAAAVGDADVPAPVRQEAAAVIAARMGDLTPALGDVDPAVRAIAGHAVARDPARAATVARGLGSQGDPTTIAPVIAAAMPAVGRALLAADASRGLTITASLITGRVTEWIAIARAPGKDAARLAAIDALGRVGTAEAEAALRAILAAAGEDTDVRGATYRALRRLERRKGKTYAGDRPKRGEHVGGVGGAGAAPAEAPGPEQEEEDDEYEDEDDDDE